MVPPQLTPTNSTKKRQRLNSKILQMFWGKGEYWAVACRGLVMPAATAWLDAPYQIPVLNSGIWWPLLLDIRCLWRQNMTPYSRLQTNVLAKFVDTTCIFRDAGAAVGKMFRRHGGTSAGLAPTSKSPSPPNWITKHYKSVEFLSNFRISSPIDQT